MNDVSAIILNFRDALRALVPIAERVGLPWKDGESYDEWDGIAQALFAALVVAVLPQPESAEKHFAKYDMRYENYMALRRIIVRAKNEEEMYTFVAFATREVPFDSVRVVCDGVCSDQAIVMSADSVEFYISDA